MAAFEHTCSSSSMSESGKSDQVSDLTASTGSEFQSLLDHLKAPPPQRSELSRKRVIRKNVSASQHGNICKKRPCCSTNPKSVTPSNRVGEFPNEHLRVSAGVLFCAVCREELSLKRSIVTNHKQSTLKLAKKESREKDIAEALASYDQQEQPRGETLSKKQRIYHINVVTAFLKAGVPLAKLDHFLNILGEHAYQLSDRRGMSDFILSEEIKQIREDINGKPVSIIFDGQDKQVEQWHPTVKPVGGVRWDVFHQIVQ